MASPFAMRGTQTAKQGSNASCAAKRDPSAYENQKIMSNENNEGKLIPTRPVLSTKKPSV
jgi:hypothetical protein